VVVGAGPAGPAAAIRLARFLRSIRLTVGNAASAAAHIHLAVLSR
jgi:thioredoxin reductase